MSNTETQIERINHHLSQCGMRLVGDAKKAYQAVLEIDDRIIFFESRDLDEVEAFAIDTEGNAWINRMNRPRR